ncbi:MAG TPA: hypothetical protein VK658_12320, partial [Chryseolinea sp.]|nr:hypothetical protein [Chryseolinea sp.]
MRNFIKLIYIVLFVASACSQDVIDLQEPEGPVETNCSTVTAGTADFSKFVAIGSSYVAGFQAGALFNEGQDNSLAAILNKQFECAGAPAEFVQPSIKTAYGYN